MSPWQQPPIPPPESLHLSHPPDESKVPGCGRASVAMAGPREKATRPTRSLFARRQRLPPRLLPTAAPALRAL